MSEAKIRALIVDDETLARRYIHRLLKDVQAIELVGECNNGKEAVSMIRHQNPDLIFLDVQMPEMDGFDVINALGFERLPEIVFTTAYEKYAIRAFELHAIDYLLKPFDRARFKDAITQAQERLRYRQYNDGRFQLKTLLETVKRRAEYLDRLIIKANGRIIFLRTQEIDWIEADDKYVHVHTGAIARMVRQTLSAMEEQLDPRSFLRIHRSTIVNVHRIRELQPLLGGDHAVVMEDGTRLTLSRTHNDRLFKLLCKRL